MPRVSIGCVHEELPELPDAAVVVVVDVIRSTTTAISCAASGRRCVVAPTIEAAIEWRARLPNAYLAGELGGNMPYGFDLNNSPAAVALLPDPSARPLILLSTSGTRLMSLAAARHRTFAAALRNWDVQAAALAAERPDDIVLLGAGTRGEFREEDQLCCAWIAGALVGAGFHADEETIRLVERWRAAPVESIRISRSAQYLEDSGQGADLEFILEHVADLPATFAVRGSDVVPAASSLTH